jgi:hypothetical protein
MTRGEKVMYRNLRHTLGMALGLLGLVSSLVFAAQPASKSLPSAQLIAVEGAAHTYHLTDYDGRVITTTVPAQSLTDIQTTNPDGTVQATIVAIDMTANRVKARTDAGQILILAVPHESLAGLQLGDTFTLAVSQQAVVTGQR